MTEPRPADRPDPTIRPFAEEDRPFFAAIVGRLQPAVTAAPRDPAAMADYFRRLAGGEVEQPTGTEAFVATDPDGAPLGVIILHPITEFFTGHGRAYVGALVVAVEAEGRGVGASLLRHAEAWARDRGLIEVSLDVFVGNDRVRAFYERAGYAADHVRMVKRLSQPRRPTGRR